MLVLAASKDVITSRPRDFTFALTLTHSCTCNCQASNPTVAGAVVLEWKRDAGGWTEEEVAKLAESGDTFIVH